MNTTTQIKIEGLRHITATGHLEKAMEAVPGVESVELDAERECAVVEHAGADPVRLMAVAAKEGFPATAL